MSQMFALPKDAYFSIKTKDRHLGQSKKCFNLMLYYSRSIIEINLVSFQFKFTVILIIIINAINHQEI